MAMNLKQINAAIKRIGTASGKLRDTVQSVAVQIVGHCIVHGDISAADRLLAALGKGADRQTLVWWFERHAPVRFKDGAFKMSSPERRKAFAPMTDAELAALPKWYEFAKDVAALTSITKDVGRLLVSSLVTLDVARAKANDGVTVTINNPEDGGETLEQAMRKLVTRYGLTGQLSKELADKLPPAKVSEKAEA